MTNLHSNCSGSAFPLRLPKARDVERHTLVDATTSEEPAKRSVWLIEAGFTHLDEVLSILQERPAGNLSLDIQILSDATAARCCQRPTHPSCIFAAVGHGNTVPLRALSKRMAVVATGQSCDVSVIVESTKKGATEFLEAPYSSETVWRSVRRALSHDEHLAQERAHFDKIRSCYRSLTPRERDVLPLLTNGLLNKQAASVLGISLVTLQIHRGNIMRKMQASSFAELVRASVMLESAVRSPSHAPSMVPAY